MTQPTGEPGVPGQAPPGGPPPSWQQAPQAPQPPQPAQAAPPPPPPPQSWQQAPQQPVAPVAPPPPAPPPSWTAGLTSTAPIAGPAGFVYGDVPNRSIAFIIDAIIVGIIRLVIAGITLAIFGTKVSDITNPSMLSVLAFAVVWYGIVFVYFWYLWTRTRGTIGMKLLRMQIGHETDGRTIDDRAGVIRIVAIWGPSFVADILTAFALGLGFLANLVAFIWFLALLYTTAKSPTHQGLHDQYAHTMVVKAARSAG